MSNFRSSFRWRVLLRVYVAPPAKPQPPAVLAADVGMTPTTDLRAFGMRVDPFRVFVEDEVVRQFELVQAA